MTSNSLVCLFAVVFVAFVSAEDAADECHPKPHAPGKHEKCCNIPDLMKKKDVDEMHKAFHDCIGAMKETHPEILPERFQGPPPTEDGPHSHPPHPHPHPHGPPPVKFLECIQECIYNNSGLMTPEMKPNPEAIQKMADEYIGDQEKLKPIASEAIKKCTEHAPAVSDDAVCKSGALETTLCVMREMYMHCPEESWNDSEECKAEKALLEKCPNMPPPFAVGPHGGHHHKH